MNWVFGYGSLMWRPGFSFREKSPATLKGHHRGFCRISLRHRGTPKAPGMVVGLMPGGECRGYAFLPKEGGEAATLAYLDDREGEGYRRAALPIVIETPQGDRHGEAWVYLPQQEHPTYAGDLPRERIVALIATGQGESGTARDYLAALIDEMARLGIADPALESVLAEVEQVMAGDGAPAGGDGRDSQTQH